MNRVRNKACSKAKRELKDDWVMHNPTPAFEDKFDQPELNFDDGACGMVHKYGAPCFDIREITTMNGISDWFTHNGHPYIFPKKYREHWNLAWRIERGIRT